MSPKTTASTNLLYVSQNVVRKPSQNVVRSEHFSRIPDSVLLDPDLTDSAVRVYGFLAGRTRNNKNLATCGIRLISTKLHRSKTTISRALRLLEKCGHINIHAVGKQRRSYALTSDIFRRVVVAEAAGEAVEVHKSGGVVQKRLVKVRAG